MTKNIINIVSIVPKNYIHFRAFDEIIDSITASLDKLGLTQEKSTNHIKTDKTNIIIGWHLLNEGQLLQLPKGTIIYNLEQLDVKNKHLITKILKFPDNLILWDYSRKNIKALRSYGFKNKAHLMQPAYSPALNRISKPTTQNIDVLFYGSINERRQRVINQLKQLGLNTQVVSGLYGEERDNLIARSKVILNMHYYESSIFESIRVSYLLANSKAVVTEIGNDTEIDVAFKECVYGVDYNKLAQACFKLVKDDDLRGKYEAQALTNFMKFKQENLLSEALHSSGVIDNNAYDLIIYVPTYQRKQNLTNCLAALSAAIHGLENLVHIVVSNNGSDDGTTEYLNSLNYSWLTVYHNEKNEGAFSNILGGFSLTEDSRFLWIIGDDDYVTQSSVKNLLSIINEYPEVEYIYCNTKAYPPQQYQQVIDNLLTDGDAVGGVIKSKYPQEFSYSFFPNLINPQIADTLLGELMVNVYKRSSLYSLDLDFYHHFRRSYPSFNWETEDFDACGTMAQPHNLPFLHCFSKHTIAIYSSKIQTINFWGSAEWLNDYDLIFPVIILFLIKGYYDQGIIDSNHKDKLINYYLQAMGPSISRQNTGTSKARPFSQSIKSVLFDNLTPYFLSAVKNRGGGS